MLQLSILIFQLLQPFRLFAVSCALHGRFSSWFGRTHILGGPVFGGYVSSPPFAVFKGWGFGLLAPKSRFLSPRYHNQIRTKIKTDTFVNPPFFAKSMKGVTSLGKMGAPTRLH